MTPAIKTIGKNKCTGCFGCYNSCPHDAICMEIENGFFIPKINKKKCNNCGLCNSFCPVIDNPKENFINPKSFAAKTKDKKLLLKSSSGGIFGELANSFLKRGGIVYGAGFDQEFNLKHIKIRNKKDLEKILGSKYIQSNIDFTYKNILSLLRKKNKILFCGTPCQVSSLNLFIKKIPAHLRENILTCDLVCHGVPSTIIFNRYLEKLQKKYKSKIKSIFFRSKEIGWRNFSMKIFFKNKRYLKCHRVDPFMQNFLSNNYLRESCYNCEFSKFPRVGDITLGDLWGAVSGFYHPDGVSFVSTNSKRGERAIKDLERENRIILKKYLLSQAIKDNPRIGEYFIRKGKKITPSIFSIYLWHYLSMIKTFYQNVFYKKLK